MDALVELRKRLSGDPSLPPGTKLTYMPFFMKVGAAGWAQLWDVRCTLPAWRRGRLQAETASNPPCSPAPAHPHTTNTAQAAALALRDYPTVNASLSADQGSVLAHRRVHLGIAMATPHGLAVPSIKDVQARACSTQRGSDRRGWRERRRSSGTGCGPPARLPVRPSTPPRIATYLPSASPSSSFHPSRTSLCCSWHPSWRRWRRRRPTTASRPPMCREARFPSPTSAPWVAPTPRRWSTPQRHGALPVAACCVCLRRVRPRVGPCACTCSLTAPASTDPSHFRTSSPLPSLQVAIMAVGRVQRLPRFAADGATVVPAHVMAISLGADHRWVRGWVGG